MNTNEKCFWYSVIVAVVVGSALLLGGLFYGYAGDEWGSPPFDERSVPPSKTY
jgi:hypothetical protein